MNVNEDFSQAASTHLAAQHDLRFHVFYFGSVGWTPLGAQPGSSRVTSLEELKL